MTMTKGILTPTNILLSKANHTQEPEIRWWRSGVVPVPSGASKNPCITRPMTTQPPPKENHQ